MKSKNEKTRIAKFEENTRLEGGKTFLHFCNLELKKTLNIQRTNVLKSKIQKTDIS